MQNLRNIANYVDSFWDWTFLNGCFGLTRIKVSDIDGIVERNGRFLVIETKKPHEGMSGGQRIMYQQLVAIEKFTLLVVVGEVNSPQRVELWNHKGIQHYAPATLQTIKNLVTEWFDQTNRREPFTPTAPRLDRVICGISGQECRLCKGVPCEGSTPLDTA